MTAITHCPACQTQFVVTDEQLDQHNGTVRCGHCLHVFNAADQIVPINVATENISQTIDKVDALIQEAPDFINTNEFTNKNSENSLNFESSHPQVADVEINNPDFSRTIHATPENEVVSTISPFNKPKLIHRKVDRFPKWLTIALISILLVAAITQAIYYLRSDIVVYYPGTKPYLLKLCEKIHCTVDLPKKIELIVIDDSDIQEDTVYVGLIHLTSTLINRAQFNQAYPNLVLTLTDAEDKAKLIHVFEPKEYLPANIKVMNGLGAGEELKVKLAMTTQGETVSGYRVLVTY